MSEPTDVQVIDNPDMSRFEVRSGGRLAGRAEYRLRPGKIVLTHTEVDAAFEGRGLAGQLARGALDAARERGLRVVPLCPYIARYIRRHPEYVPLVDDRYRSQFTGVPE